MSWDILISRADEDADTGGKRSLGGAARITAAIKTYFPRCDEWLDGLLMCDSAGGPVSFKYQKARNFTITVEAHPTSTRLKLLLFAMAHDNGWSLLDMGSGEAIEVNSIREVDAVLKIQQDAKSPPKTYPGVPKKIRLPRITEKAALVSSELTFSYLALVMLNEAETGQNLVLDIPRRVPQEQAVEEVNWYPMSFNEEVLLPDGRRLAALHLHASRIEQATDLMREYYAVTGRVSATVHGGSIKLTDGTRFRITECYYLMRNPGRGWHS